MYKKTLLFFVLVSTSLLVAIDRKDKRIAKLLHPYKDAIAFVLNFDVIDKVNDNDVYIFFNNNELYKKKDIKKLRRTLHIAKKLSNLKKLSDDNRNEFKLLVNNLEKVESFVGKHSATHYALIIYHKIMTFYESLDEKNDSLVNLITSQSKELGFSSMQGRGLYKFARKIDLDLRRLTALFIQNTLSDDLMVIINTLKTKLILLKSKIAESSMYKSQLNKTRWLKAIGVIIYLTTIALVVIFFNGVLPGTSDLSISWLALPLILSVRSVITIKELTESTRYNIPVHSSSIFSWFRPLLPLTWMPRG